ncbi:Glu-tRNA(Gln) amidotransferase subunit GatD [Candidatus Nitrosocosmicus sp. SS]|jgi:glutamyl-tRNA(Gln) amidotransferase subunit D|nr:Glu-tRNA(Gln) amidotransferase subunit GatD [Candidatus Nitrosocosmicus sp. SS]KAF0867977.1 Glu-tRNA(Gln) amidotransferase subunit GatD [Candidatus Nitrosocosmicus sp. SS]
MDLNNTKKSEEYSQNSQKLLEKFKVCVGDEVRIITSKEGFSGIILPRYETFSDKYIVLKLKSGYNIGIDINHIEKIEAIQINSSTNKLSPNPQIQNLSDMSNSISYQGISLQSTSSKQNRYIFDRIESKPHSKTLPRILLISTGGTIASKIDYRTGGVTSLLSASELYGAFPELENHGYIYPEFLLNEYSENITPDHWTIIAQRISQAVTKEHFDGIIISHGTDTLHYTSSALSFALKNIPIPVILVGSQRSSDRPSSDAFSNLVGAIRFIKDSKYSGIFVCMHHNTSDEVIACHLGTRVRKNHTSKRDAFKSLDSLPFALIDQKGEIKYNDILHKDLIKRKETLKNFAPRTTFDDKVFLLKFYPGLNPSFLEAFLNLDYKVIILEGTGLGHINKACFPIISKLINCGIFVFMTSQCIFGRVQMTVYDTGRDLLGLGVIPLSNMGPETAVVKAMWALHNSSGPSDFIRIMTVDYAYEMSTALPLVSLKSE